MPHELLSPGKKKKDGTGFVRPRKISAIAPSRGSHQRLSDHAEKQRRAGLKESGSQFKELLERLQKSKVPLKDWPAKIEDIMAQIGEEEDDDDDRMVDDDFWHNASIGDGFGSDGDLETDSQFDGKLSDPEISSESSSEDESDSDDGGYDDNSIETTRPRRLRRLNDHYEERFTNDGEQNCSQHVRDVESLDANWDRFVEWNTGDGALEQNKTSCSCVNPCQYRCECIKSLVLYKAISFNGTCTYLYKFLS
jgi:hypothetical protein